MSDDVVWQLIKNGFCAFRKATDVKPFCTNIYNVTGLCNHASCPLANSNYATVIEDQGNLLLCLKTVERCHTPRDQWQKVVLSKNKKRAISEIIEQTKVGFSSHLTQKCKLRFNKLKEVLQRMRFLAKNKKTKLMPVKKKINKREMIREKKAEIAAKLETSIEEELLKRLNTGIYGELYDFSEIKTEEKQELVETTPVKAKKADRRRKLNIEYETEEQQLEMLKN